MRRSQTAATTVGSLRDDRVGSFGYLVLARTSDRREILSVSLFWGGRHSDHDHGLVLEDRETNSDVESHARAFRARAPRGVRHKSGRRGDTDSSRGEINKARAPFSLVARGDGCLHHRSWLRQSTSMVPIAAGAGGRSLRRRRVRICRIKNFCEKN